MAVDLLLRPSGLVTNPNPVSSALPNGSMREALNVILRRDGIVQQRPGYLQTAVDAGAKTVLTGNPWRMAAWGDDILYATSVGKAAFVDVATGDQLNNAETIFDEPGSGGALRSAETRSNLYVTARDGIRKYTSSATASAHTGANGAGFIALLSLVTGSVLSNGNQAAYRMVLVRRDSNSVVVTSSPSARWVITNSLGGARSVSMSIYHPTVAVAGDEVHVYRSSPQAATANDIMYLAYKHVLVAADISAGYFTFTDTTADSDLGAALYTNEAQEGILQANTIPPRAQDLAMFRSSLWGADVQARKSASVTFKMSYADLAGSAGFGYRTISGTSAIGSATITGVASTTGIEAGQILLATSGNGTDFKSGSNLARVVSKTANSITFNNTSTALRAPGSYVISDAIELWGDSNVYAASNPLLLLAAVNLGTVSTGQFSTNGSASTLYTADLVTSYDVTSTSDIVATFVFYEKNPGDIARASTYFSVNGSNGSYCQPALSAWNTSPGSADASFVDANAVINGLIYSKTDQPEAMPYPANLIRIGSSSQRIDRIASTRDALWVFKRDGIFRVTGSGASAGWRVDPVSIGTWLVSADSVVVLGEDVIAWTNTGVAKIGDAGIEELSAPKINDLLEDAQNAATSATMNSYSSTIARSGWAVASPKSDEYMLAVPDMSGGTLTNNAPAYVYVYNTLTQAWTRWTFAAPVYHGVNGVNGSTVVLQTTEQSGDVVAVYYYDVEQFNALAISATDRYWTGQAITKVDNGDGTVEVTLTAAITGYSPSEGDLVTSGTAAGVITAVDGTNPDTVFTITLVTGVYADMGTTADIAASFQMTAEFVARMSMPGVEKKWRDGAVIWNRRQVVNDYDISFTSSLSATAVSAGLNPALEAVNETVPKLQRFWVPRSHARAGALFPSIGIRSMVFELYGITLASDDFQPAGRR